MNLCAHNNLFCLIAEQRSSIFVFICSHRFREFLWKQSLKCVCRTNLGGAKGLLDGGSALNQKGETIIPTNELEAPKETKTLPLHALLPSKIPKYNNFLKRLFLGPTKLRNKTKKIRQIYQLYLYAI